MPLVEIDVSVTRVGAHGLLYAVDGADVTIQNADGSARQVFADEAGNIIIPQPLKSRNGRIDGWVDEGIKLRYRAVKPGELEANPPWEHFVSGGGPVGPTGPAGATGPAGPAGEVTHAMLRRGAFSARTGRTAGQTIAAGAWALVILGAEDWDVSGWFDTVNYRFTPQVAGYYRFNAMAGWTSQLAQYVFTTLGLGVNGTVTKRLAGLEVPRLSNAVYPGGSAMVLLNGTTDYVDLRVYHNDAASRDLAFGADSVYLQGELIAPSA